MTVLVETGTWTASGSTPQTVTLSNGSLTPVAIIVWMVRRAAAAAGFVATQTLAIGFGTRQGGATQSGSMCMVCLDNVTPTDSGRIRNTVLQHVLSSTTTTDYTVALDSFGAGTFTVSYSNAANSSGDVFAYTVIGGISNAVVLNHVLSGTGASEGVTGAGFLPSCLLALDVDLASDNTTGTGLALSFGCATSSSQFWCTSVTQTDGDTMTSQMNWNKAFHSDSCIERLAINSDNSDARWDLDSFDADGFTLGIVDAPSNTDRIVTFLLLGGCGAEAGVHTKSAATGNDTFTLTNSALDVAGVILGNTRDGTGVITADATLCLGAGSTANTTRGSAVNQCVGITGPEAISTTADRFSATDSVIEELTGGATPAETSEAWFDTKGLGSFIIDWAVNGGSTNLIGYLALGTVLITGSGSGAASPFAGSGAAIETFSGSGTGAVSTFAGSGTGAETFDGSGSGALASFDGTGSSTVTDTGVSGSGTGAASSFAASGTGEETFTGSGSGALASFDGSGSAELTFLASGSGALSSFDSTGTGEETFTGSGSGELQPFAGSGSGEESFDGSGAGAISSFAGSGSSEETFNGSGSGALTSFDADGTGDETFSGTGGGAFAVFDANGSGAETFTGSGSGAMSSFDAFGIGGSGDFVLGFGSGALAIFAGAGAGEEAITGSGSGAFALFDGSGSGYLLVAGTGSGALAPFSGSGTGTTAVAFVGSGSGALSAFIGIGIGTASSGITRVLPDEFARFIGSSLDRLPIGIPSNRRPKGTPT